MFPLLGDHLNIEDRDLRVFVCFIFQVSNQMKHSTQRRLHDDLNLHGGSIPPISTTSLSSQAPQASRCKHHKLTSHNRLVFFDKRSVPRNEVKWDYNICMYYAYILRSLKDKSFYIGSTADLKRRLEKHNHKEVTYSSTKAPFEIVWYGAFKNKKLAIDFEMYLKSSSGFAFRNKRLI